MNTTKTIFLMVGLTVLLVFIGGAFGGRQGMILGTFDGVVGADVNVRRIRAKLDFLFLRHARVFY